MAKNIDIIVIYIFTKYSFYCILYLSFYVKVGSDLELIFRTYNLNGNRGIYTPYGQHCNP